MNKIEKLYKDYIDQINRCGYGLTPLHIERDRRKARTDLLNELLGENNGLQKLLDALNKFRYAKEYAAAESWDLTKETKERFEWAATNANNYFGELTNNEIAKIAQEFHGLLEE